MLSPHVRLIQHEAGAFLLNIASDRCFGVNKSGAAILQCLQDGQTSPQEIAYSLANRASARRLDIDAERINADVTAFFERLRAADIIE